MKRFLSDLIDAELIQFEAIIENNVFMGVA